jgi:GTP pyrophosphokinase
MIEVSWDIDSDKLYTVSIDIVCNDKSGVLNALMMVPSESKINISSINARTHRNKTATVTMSLEVKNSTQIETIMTKFRRAKDVYSVCRSLASGGKEG